jgi:hypothetical protein
MSNVIASSAICFFMRSYSLVYSFGLLLSIPDAIITKAYAPIIGMGALGGIIIGAIIGRFGR